MGKKTVIASIWALATASVALGSTALAASQEAAIQPPPEQSAKIRAALKTRLPDLAVSDIHTSPIPGLYEILAPDGIVYTDANGEHLVMGQIVDTGTRQNLTMQRWNALNAIDFNSLPLPLAIKSTHGNGTRQIAVFADPECPYCQDLEAQLAKLEDVTVYTFLFPLEDIHPGATRKAHQLWCASDRVAAWSTWMVHKQLPPEKEPADKVCANDPVKELAALGERLRIHTTPTIFFHSGHRSSGLPAKEEFERLLKSESAPVVAAQAPDSHPGA